MKEEEIVESKKKLCYLGVQYVRSNQIVWHLLRSPVDLDVGSSSSLDIPSPLFMSCRQTHEGGKVRRIFPRGIGVWNRIPLNQPHSKSGTQHHRQETISDSWPGRDS